MIPLTNGNDLAGTPQPAKIQIRRSKTLIGWTTASREVWIDGTLRARFVCNGPGRWKLKTLNGRAIRDGIGNDITISRCVHRAMRDKVAFYLELIPTARAAAAHARKAEATRKRHDRYLRREAAKRRRRDAIRVHAAELHVCIKGLLDLLRSIDEGENEADHPIFKRADRVLARIARESKPPATPSRKAAA